jgi:proteasome lid subunit RPN8/RPN11
VTLSQPQWTSAVLDELQRQAFSSPDAEAVGVLVGRRNTGAQTQVTSFVTVARAVEPGQQAALTHEGMEYAHRQMAAHHRAEAMVGWYLIRPNGAFLTPFDVAAHQQFFNGEDDICLVIDPRSAVGGVYAMRAGRLELVYSGQVTPPDGQPAGIAGGGGSSASAVKAWPAYVVLALMGFVFGSVLWLGAVVTGVL